MMRIDNQFKIEDTVYLKTDPDQAQFIIVAIKICPSNVLMYLLAYCDETSWHYEFELSAEQDVVKKVK